MRAPLLILLLLSNCYLIFPYNCNKINVLEVTMCFLSSFSFLCIMLPIFSSIVQERQLCDLKCVVSRTPYIYISFYFFFVLIKYFIVALMVNNYFICIFKFLDYHYIFEIFSFLIYCIFIFYF